MEINIRNYVPKFQEGGPIEEQPVEQVPEEAPAQDPMQELIAACQQVLDTQDCNLAMQVIQAVLQMIGGQAEAPQTQPVYKKGGILVKRIPKD